MIRLCCFVAAVVAVAFTARVRSEPAVPPGPAPRVKTADELLGEVQAAINRRDTQEALKLANLAMGVDPKNPQVLYVRGRIFEGTHDHARAIADYTESIRLQPKAPEVYQHRGNENFRAGRIKAAVADFEKFISFDPSQAAYHWQLGIAYYYDGRYADGAKLFELHQTVNPQDVENAVWHFLCVTRKDGLEKARQGLIPISGDSRVPMRQIHALFAGKGSVEEVLKEAGQNESAVFYAHLYLGLYFEATGDAVRAREHIDLAAAQADANNYMGDVARVHAQMLKKLVK